MGKVILRAWRLDADEQGDVQYAECKEARERTCRIF
jgi:hypothetical protein